MVNGCLFPKYGDHLFHPILPDHGVYNSAFARLQKQGGETKNKQTHQQSKNNYVFIQYEYNMNTNVCMYVCVCVCMYVCMRIYAMIFYFIISHPRILTIHINPAQARFVICFFWHHATALYTEQIGSASTALESWITVRA